VTTLVKLESDYHISSDSLIMASSSSVELEQQSQQQQQENPNTLDPDRAKRNFEHTMGSLLSHYPSPHLPSFPSLCRAEQLFYEYSGRPHYAEVCMEQRRMEESNQWRRAMGLSEMLPQFFMQFRKAYESLLRPQQQGIPHRANIEDVRKAYQLFTGENIHRE
jgi:hypothetical protein